MEKTSALQALLKYSAKGLPRPTPVMPWEGNTPGSVLPKPKPLPWEGGLPHVPKPPIPGKKKGLIEKASALDAYRQFKLAEDEEEKSRRGFPPELTGAGYGALGGSAAGIAIPLLLALIKKRAVGRFPKPEHMLATSLMGGGAGAAVGAPIGAGLGLLRRLSTDPEDEDRFGGEDEVGRASMTGRAIGAGAGALPGMAWGAASGLGPFPGPQRTGRMGDREAAAALRRLGLRTTGGTLLGAGLGGIAGAGIGAGVGRIRRALRGDESEE
jgi:hypothetical protein